MSENQKLSMSLDQIIEKNKKNTNNRSGKSFGSRRNVPRGNLSKFRGRGRKISNDRRRGSNNNFSGSRRGMRNENNKFSGTRGRGRFRSNVRRTNPRNEGRISKRKVLINL